jgi:hypothetical protein
VSDKSSLKRGHTQMCFWARSKGRLDRIDVWHKHVGLFTAFDGFRKTQALECTLLFGGGLEFALLLIIKRVHRIEMLGETHTICRKTNSLSVLTRTHESRFTFDCFLIGKRNRFVLSREAGAVGCGIWVRPTQKAMSIGEAQDRGAGPEALEKAFRRRIQVFCLDGLTPLVKDIGGV